MNITLEECAEVTQGISKVFRFGFDGVHPNSPTVTNKMHLEEEVGDLVCMIHLLVQNNILDGAAIEDAAAKKLEKLEKWSPDALGVEE